jgi:glycosyltransferase involved in cell wall biosynthesis
MIAVHDFPEKHLWFYRLLFRRALHVLATNEWKKGALVARLGLSPERISVIPNAVDIKEFALDTSKENACRTLGLNPSKRYAVYTGHLYGWKGVDTLARAAILLPKEWEVLFVGGRVGDIAEFRTTHAGNARIRLIGQRPHKEIPLWQRAADVLVLPNTAKKEISLHYTSPMKLFEYMASGRPIVASDIPSITEHLTADRGVLVRPDDEQALSAGILEATLAEAVTRTRHAQEYVSGLSWALRADKMFLMQESDISPI